MKSIAAFLVIIAILAGCATGTTVDIISPDLRFSALLSDFRITDTNNYGCETIDSSALQHVLRTGVIVSERDLHDFYSTTGCSITEKVSINGEPTGFTFDYGGIFYFSNGQVLACGEQCCKDGFVYCTWVLKT